MYGLQFIALNLGSDGFGLLLGFAGLVSGYCVAHALITST